MNKLLLNIIGVCVAFFLVSCEDLTEVNINPNAIDPLTADPNLMMPSFIGRTMRGYQAAGFKDKFAGVVQYIQHTGWSGGVNRFDWVGAEDWDGTYALLKDIQYCYDRSVELDYEFHQGVCLVMRAFQFAQLTDRYGDIPYSEALSPVSGGTNLFPVFDDQKDVYEGIINELKDANDLLSKGDMKEYAGDPGNKAIDPLYGFDPVKWRKLANSLMLRYYMRLSVKDPAYAEAGIKDIVNNSGKFPIFTSNDDDALMDYPGTAPDHSWDGNLVYDQTATPFFYRVHLCAGFRDVLVDFKDPRLPVWFNKVDRKISIDETPGAEDDVVRDGVRYLSANKVASSFVLYDKNTWVANITAGKTLIDTTDYVGMPLGFTQNDGLEYNLCPATSQGFHNVHASALTDMYREANGDLLQARMISYAEVCFILAEAAQKGWISGAQDWYEKGVKASLEYWGLGDEYDTYIQNAGVAYNGANALEQIITQKWISNWTVAVESWCDWRRTGYPVFTFGPRTIRNDMPIRYRYGFNEQSRNLDNYKEAIKSLEATSETKLDVEGIDSAWSKMWLLK